MTLQVPRIAILVFVLSLIGSVVLSTLVAEERTKYVIRPPTSATIIRAGFNKMQSHINWMFVIQQRAKMDNVTKNDATVLKKKFDTITTLDPLFARAYEEGAMHIEYADPEAALDLLDKAMHVDKMKSWKIPFLAAFIAKMRLKDNGRALELIGKAVSSPDRPSYVKRFQINLEASLPGTDPLHILDLWVEYYDGGASRFGMGGPANVARPSIGGAMMMDETDRRMVLTRISRLSSEIISNSKKSLQTEKDPEQKRVLQNRITKVEQVLKVVYGNTKVCSACFRPYGEGERFCKYDGTAVIVFGICPNPKCQTTIGKVTYCPKCGTKAN